MRFTKPKKSGVKLPTLSNPASAENVQIGYDFIGENGNKITGTHEEEPGLDTSDATATAANIDNGKTAYINGVKVTGTSNKVDTSDATATAANIDKGKTAYGSTGKLIGSKNIPSCLAGKSLIILPSSGSSVTVTLPFSGDITAIMAMEYLDSTIKTNTYGGNINGKTIYGAEGKYSFTVSRVDESHIKVYQSGLNNTSRYVFLMVMQEEGQTKVI